MDRLWRHRRQHGWTKECNTCASFCANAWICACQATDRDLESSSTGRKANAWMCARRATDRDLEKVSAVRKVNAWICASLTTDHDPASVIPDRKRKSVTTAFFADLMFFELISPVTIFCNF